MRQLKITCAPACSEASSFVSGGIEAILITCRICLGCWLGLWFCSFGAVCCFLSFFFFLEGVWLWHRAIKAFFAFFPPCLSNVAGILPMQVTFIPSDCELTHFTKIFVSWWYTFSFGWNGHPIDINDLLKGNTPFVENCNIWLGCIARKIDFLKIAVIIHVTKAQDEIRLTGAVNRNIYQMAFSES